MIIYQEMKSAFLRDIEERNIDEKVARFYRKRLGRNPSPKEKNSWKNSLEEMYYVLNTTRIPHKAKVTIEYNLPTSNYRVDFIISGTDRFGKANAVLIELKQWQKAELVIEKDAVVKTYLGGNSNRETIHPSYQIWSYLQYFKDFSERYHRDNYEFQSCAYLHNYRKATEEPLLNRHYSFYTKRAPIYFRGQKNELSDFIGSQIQGDDKFDVITSLDREPKKPNISLQKDIFSIINKNKEFVLLDSQKIVFEEVKRMARLSHRDRQKRVLIIEGGPGTGKSVLAFQLLANFLKKGLNTAYVTKNSALRQVFSSKLTKNQGNRLTLSKVNNLMRGTSSFLSTPDNSFDVLIVDEAHRLTLKSGMFKNKGENQIKEIINASRMSIFFVDDHQMVTADDIGHRENILAVAKSLTLDTNHIKTLLLKSQFRLNGSNNFLNWIDDVLGIEPSKKPIVLKDYDFRIIDDVDDFYQKIKELNTENNARIVAGYCWDWLSKKNQKLTDINLSENFHKQWNLNSDPTWAISEKSFEQIGCVHTSQGVEFDHIGVIVGNDLAIENGELVAKPLNRAKTDKSLRGLTALLRKNNIEATRIATRIIMNTYRVLFTRATKSCLVYFINPQVRLYFENKLNKKEA